MSNLHGASSQFGPGTPMATPHHTPGYSPGFSPGTCREATAIDAQCASGHHVSGLCSPTEPERCIALLVCAMQSASPLACVERCSLEVTHNCNVLRIPRSHTFCGAGAGGLTPFGGALFSPMASPFSSPLNAAFRYQYDHISYQLIMYHTN